MGFFFHNEVKYLMPDCYLLTLYITFEFFLLNNRPYLQLFYSMFFNSAYWYLINVYVLLV